MTEHLESLVETATQKELVDKELSLARDLQESLIPTDLPSAESLRFATLFEPSAAIGGDYFDILRVDADRLAVVIADVSGHGLPTGLRMAMVKAALVILVEEAKPPEQILQRLSDLIRSSRERRYFVTATIAVVDFRRGTIELTNAGHPPTYLLRGGRVEEILLPGPPLGTLGSDYGQRRIDLREGDIVVWLSDGLIEAANADLEPFGYERLARSLQAEIESPSEARDRLLEALRRHTGGHPADDDRTLVAMRYGHSPPTASSFLESNG
jgi:sigma-B regulation protein RsbU (phosphoserine phosphatase)